MPVTKKKGAIFAIYADSPVQSTSTSAASASTHTTVSIGAGAGIKGTREKHERVLSPIKKTGKPQPLASKPRRALEVKTAGSLGGGKADDKKARITDAAGLEEGDSKAEAKKGQQNANRTSAGLSRAAGGHGHGSRASVNPKPTFQPMMLKSKSTSSKRLFEVLSGASSPTRSNTPLPSDTEEASSNSIKAQTAPRAGTSRTGKSPAKKSRSEVNSTLGQAVRTSTNITRTRISATTTSALTGDASTSTARTTRTKSKLFDVYADTEQADKENTEPTHSSSMLDSPASRTRSKTQTSVTTAPEHAVSPSTTRSRAVPQAKQAGSAKKAAPRRRALGDVFVLGDVSQAYGASGEEPEGFKVRFPSSG